MMKNNIVKAASSRIILAVFLLALSIGASGCASSTVTVPLPDTTNDYVLGVGDSLRIIVYGQPELTGEYKVDARGIVAFPLVNDIPAAGYTTADLEQFIVTRLDTDYIVDPRVSVEVLSYRSVYVLGEVQTPGLYEYAPNMTALQAIAAAGGYTYRANENTAELTRHTKSGLSTATIEQKTMIKPGDTIVVKRRWF